MTESKVAILWDTIKNHNTVRDADIVKMRNSNPPATFRAIGDKWGITPQRAWKIYLREYGKLCNAKLCLTAKGTTNGKRDIR